MQTNEFDDNIFHIYGETNENVFMDLKEIKNLIRSLKLTTASAQTDKVLYIFMKSFLLRLLNSCEYEWIECRQQKGDTIMYSCAVSDRQTTHLLNKCIKLERMYVYNVS